MNNIEIFTLLYLCKCNFYQSYNLNIHHLIFDFHHHSLHHMSILNHYNFCTCNFKLLYLIQNHMNYMYFNQINNNLEYNCINYFEVSYLKIDHNSNILYLSLDMLDNLNGIISIKKQTNNIHLNKYISISHSYLIYQFEHIIYKQYHSNIQYKDTYISNKYHSVNNNQIHKYINY